jgi:hypothetical protein
MRGVIENTARAQQINDFSGLLYGKITPTDIDGLIEYQDKAYVFIEVKYNGKDLPYGQRLAIKRLVDDTSAQGKQAIALIVNHEVADTSASVPVAECIVREMYHSKEKLWRPPKMPMTTREIIDGFLKAAGCSC